MRQPKLCACVIKAELIDLLIMHLKWGWTHFSDVFNILYSMSMQRTSCLFLASSQNQQSWLTVWGRRCWDSETAPRNFPPSILIHLNVYLVFERLKYAVIKVPKGKLKNLLILFGLVLQFWGPLFCVALRIVICVDHYSFLYKAALNIHKRTNLIRNCFFLNFTWRRKRRGKTKTKVRKAGSKV